MSTHVANREWSGIARREVLVTIVKAFAGSMQAVRRMCPTRADSAMISYWAEGGTCELDTAATEVKRTDHH